MKHAVIVVMLAFALRVDADPAPLDEAEVGRLVDGLADQTDEPIGLLATAAVPKLGLEKGDVVRAIDGAPALVARFLVVNQARSSAVIDLLVSRHHKELTITIPVKALSRTEHMERKDFLRSIDHDTHWGASGGYVAITNHGTPSGVMVKSAWHYAAAPVEGDIIRTIDGKRVTTGDQVMAALEAAKTHPKLVLEIDRVGAQFFETIIFDDGAPQTALEQPDPLQPGELDLTGIKKINDTTYELPKALVEQALGNPLAVSKGVRIVPAVKDGKPSGFKLYAIRPASIWIKLGLENGDTLQKVNGNELTSADKALEVYTKLRESTALAVELVRRGKIVTIRYSIK